MLTWGRFWQRMAQVALPGLGTCVPELRRSVREACMPVASSVMLDTADGPMEVYEALPEGEARAAVVVVQEAFGVNDHIRDVTRRFASEGYRAVDRTEDAKRHRSIAESLSTGRP